MPDRRHDRRAFLKASAAAAVAAGLPACGPGGGPAVEGVRDGGASGPRRPNVLFVFSDAHRAATLGCYGDAQVQTPQLDAFAAQGARLTTALSSTPECRPYRASLMTGTYAHQHGMLTNSGEHNFSVDGFQWLRGSRPTLGGAFKAAGYRCGYVGKWHLGKVRTGPGELRLGFDHYWAAASPPLHDSYTDWDYTTGEDDVVHVEGRFRPAVEVDLATAFLETADERPWFLCLSWAPPHKPHTPPAAFDHYQHITRPPNVPDYRSLTPLVGYYGMVEALDHEFGRLLAALERLGLADDTIVVYTSDHGIMLGSHGMSGKELAYSDSTRVPFLVRHPGAIPAGAVVGTPFGSPDVFPTLAGLAGVPVPAGVSGLDISGALTGRASGPARDGVLLSAFDPPPLPWPGWRGVRTERHLYARSKQGALLLYDCEADPYELTNIMDVQPALRDELDALTRELMDGLGDAWGEA